MKKTLFLTLLFGVILISFNAKLYAGSEGEATTLDYKKLFQPDFVLKAKYEFDTENGESRFSVRNSRIGFKGDVASFFSYKAVVELSSSGKFEVLDLYGKFTPTKRLSIIFGQNSIPIFNSYTVSPSSLSFANRPFLSKYFLSSRDLGINVVYKIKDKGYPIAIEAGVYNGAGINNPTWAETPTYGGRVLFGAMEKGIRTTLKAYRTSSTEEKDYFIWGWDIRYKAEQFKVEAEFMDRYEYYNERDLFSAYIQSTYQFKCNHKLISGIEPAIRWDAMGYDFLDDGLGVNRATVGLNFILNTKPIKALFRIDYEQYFRRDYMPDIFTTYQMNSNKLTFEFVVSF